MKLINKVLVIQARWEIEEKVMIFLRELRLNPPKAPVMAEEMMKINDEKN